MLTRRTSDCARFGHPEITFHLTRESPIPDIHRVLVDYFEGRVAGGTRFRAGEGVRLGWATLLLFDRGDGTLGVKERVIAPDVEWTDSVDRALRDLWCQREINDSVGLLDELDFPTQDELVMAADCALEAGPVFMVRLDDASEGFSGWSLTCPEDHDHGRRSLVPLMAVAANLPGLVQLLALPRGVSVLVQWIAKADMPSGQLHIEPHVFREGQVLPARPGSYLAALQAQPSE
ncbi:hypothetical protein [Krasilnikovia sp. MM14-A1259]|uniref:immunity protein Imm33 domain-containing protein n=1 Tax=Krasilnikovia sp. MM14-A1259 TaxID=3373539 RepID=UPI0038186E5B